MAPITDDNARNSGGSTIGLMVVHPPPPPVQSQAPHPQFQTQPTTVGRGTPLGYHKILGLGPSSLTSLKPTLARNRPNTLCLIRQHFKEISIIIMETSLLFSVIVIHTIIHKKNSNTPAIIINGSCYTNAKQYHDEKICNNCRLDCWVTGTVYLVWFGNYCLSNHLNSVSGPFFQIYAIQKFRNVRNKTQRSNFNGETT